MNEIKLYISERIHIYYIIRQKIHRYPAYADFPNIIEWVARQDFFESIFEIPFT